MKKILSLDLCTNSGWQLNFYYYDREPVSFLISLLSFIDVFLSFACIKRSISPYSFLLVPSAPVDVTARSNNTWVLLNWQVPIYPNGEIETYKILYTTDNSQKVADRIVQDVGGIVLTFLLLTLFLFHFLDPIQEIYFIQHLLDLQDQSTRNINVELN